MNCRPRALWVLLILALIFASVPQPIAAAPMPAGPVAPLPLTEAAIIVANPYTTSLSDTGFVPSLVEAPIGQLVTFLNTTNSDRTVVFQVSAAGSGGGGSSGQIYLPVAAKSFEATSTTGMPTAAGAVVAKPPVRTTLQAGDEEVTIPAGGSVQRSWDKAASVLVVEKSTESHRATIAVQAPRLDGQGRITGQIFDYKTKLPIANATVKAMTTSFQATTDANGFYSLPLPAGSYTLTLFSSGYTFSNRLVTVDNFSPQQVDPVELVPIDPKTDPIGSGGGTATNSQDTTNVQFAPGAVDSTKPIRLTELPTNEFNADYSALPGIFSDGQIPLGFVQFEPDGTVFSGPAEWTIDYDGPLPVGTNSSDGLYCYYWLEAEARWGEPVPAEVVDLGNGKKGLRATLPHFSTYGHAAPPPDGPKPPKLPGKPSGKSGEPGNAGPSSPETNPNCPSCRFNPNIGSTINIMSGELKQIIGTPGLPSAGGIPTQITARYRSTSTATRISIRSGAEQEPNSTTPTSVKWSFSIGGQSWSGEGFGLAIDWDGRNSLGEPQPPGAAIGYWTVSFGYQTSAGWSIMADTVEYPVTIQRPDLSPFGLGWFGPHDTLLIDRGRSVSIIQADSNELVYLRGESGYKPPAGEFSSLTKTADGWLRSFRDGSSMQFNADGRLTKITDRYGNFQLLQYEPNGKTVSPGAWGLTSRIKRVIDTSNNTFDFAYDANGWLASITDSTGRVTAFAHDAEGRLTSVTDALGQIERFSYDARGGMTSHTDKRNNTTNYTLDDRGRLTSRVWPTGTSLQLAQIGATTTITDDLGTVTRIAMDNEFNPVSTFNGVYSMTVSYSDDLQPQGDARTATTTLYDANGNPIHVLGANEVVAEYGAFDQPTRIQSADGNDDRFEYDAKGNLLKTTDVLGQQYAFAYNASGQPTTITDPLGNTSTIEYDARGLVTKLTDPLGKAAAFTYDAAGNLVSSTDPLGRSTTFEHDALGRTTALADALNGRSAFTYDPNGNLTAFTDPSGRATTYAYDSLDRRTKATYPDGGSDSFQYDAMGNLTGITDARGKTVANVFDPADRLVLRTIQDSPTVNYTYDNQDQLTGRDDGVLSTTVRYLPGSYGYPEQVKQTATGLPLSNVTNYDYGQFFTNPPLAVPPMPVIGTLPVETVNGDITTDTTWVGGKVYNVTSQIVVKPNVTLTIQAGALVKLNWCGSVACEGRIFVNTGASLIAQGTASQPVVFTSIHDDQFGGDTNGTASQPVAGSWVGIFADPGSRVTMTDAIVRYGGAWPGYLATGTQGAIRAEGSTLSFTRVHFDQNARAIRSINGPLSVVQSTFSDGEALVYYAGDAAPPTATLSLTDSQFIRAASSVQYDNAPAMPLTIARNRADTASTLALYGALPGDLDYDNPFGPYLMPTAGLTVPAGRTMTMRGGTVMKILNVVGSTGAKGSFSVAGTFHALGTKELPVIMSYAAIDDFGGEVPGFDYLNAQVFVPYDVATGGTMDLSFVTLRTFTGRLINAASGATVTGNHVSFIGGEIGIQADDATVQLSDSNFLVSDAGINTGATIATSEPESYWGAPGGPTTPSNGALERGANVFGKATWAPASAGIVIPSAGRLLGSTIRTLTNTIQLERYTYDAAGQRTSALAAGYAFHTLGYSYDAAGRLVARTTTSGGAPTYAFTYDKNGRITGLTSKGPGGATLVEETYAYDAMGNLTAKTHGGTTTSYAYDVLDRLISESGTAYTYDAAGNRTTAGASTFTYDAGGRVTGSSTGTTYAYDAAGNLISRTTGGQTTTFSWDTLGRLTRVDLPGGTFATYGYDDGGRRISRRTPDGATTYYVYQGDHLAQEVDATGMVIASYTYDAIDLPVSMWRAGQTYYYLTDRLGSVLGLTDSAGNVVATYAYDAWGNQTATTGSVVNPLRWAGREFDSESGFYFMRSRYYDPQVGRFISRDPIGLIGGENLYAYVDNNPLATTDPYGLDARVLTSAEMQGIRQEAIQRATSIARNAIQKYNLRNFDQAVFKWVLSDQIRKESMRLLEQEFLSRGFCAQQSRRLATTNLASYGHKQAMLRAQYLGAKAAAAASGKVAAKAGARFIPYIGELLLAGDVMAWSAAFAGAAAVGLGTTAAAQVASEVWLGE